MNEISSLANYVSTLSSERLVLRCLRRQDVSADYVRWLNDEEVNKYLESRFAEHSIESVRDFAQRIVVSETEIMWGMHVRDKSRHIGNIKLGPVDFRYRNAPLGLMIGDKSCWGHGFAAEAVEAVTTFAFEVLGLSRVEAGCYASNVGSRKAFEKCGYLHEGTRREAAIVDGAWEDVIQLGCLASGR